MQQPAAADSGKQQERMVVVAVAVAGATPGWKNIPPSWALFWRDIFPSLILFRFIIGRSAIGIGIHARIGISHPPHPTAGRPVPTKFFKRSLIQ